MRIILTCLLVILFFSMTVTFAQEKEGVKNEGAHEAEYNTDAPVRDDGPEMNSMNLAKDDENGEKKESEEESNANNSRASNTTGVDTRTTSSAGSPGIPMDDEKQSDGTNTMQRASLNIAGSPVPGEKPADDSKGNNSNSRERKKNKKK
jgi:hypothetical protein